MKFLLTLPIIITYGLLQLTDYKNQKMVEILGQSNKMVISSTSDSIPTMTTIPSSMQLDITIMNQNFIDPRTKVKLFPKSQAYQPIQIELS